MAKMKASDLMKAKMGMKPAIEVGVGIGMPKAKPDMGMGMEAGKGGKEDFSEFQQELDQMNQADLVDMTLDIAESYLTKKEFEDMLAQYAGGEKEEEKPEGEGSMKEALMGEDMGSMA